MTFRFESVIGGEREWDATASSVGALLRFRLLVPRKAS